MLPIAESISLVLQAVGFFHVILYPNRKGKACQLVNRGLKLLTRNAFVTPLYPHYRIDEAYPCDSSIILDINWTTDLKDIQLNYPVHVYPNPTLDLINFDLGDHAFKGLILFYDLLGNEKERVRLQNQCINLRLIFRI
ncbi:MAG: hypothetical protein IPJ43_07795 [Saprospiraceae bacterium]|nr:hypothetical protein [Saprospiraceae bacterium]